MTRPCGGAMDHGLLRGDENGGAAPIHSQALRRNKALDKTCQITFPVTAQDLELIENLGDLRVSVVDCSFQVYYFLITSCRRAGRAPSRTGAKTPGRSTVPPAPPATRAPSTLWAAAANGRSRAP